MEDQKIRQFFKDHQYVVKVFQTEDNGCSAYFPSKYVIDPDVNENVCVYSYQEGDSKPGIHYYSTELNDTSFVECPSYAARIVIFQDILMKTEQLGLSTKFITYFDEDNNELDNVTFVDLVAPPEDPKAVKLEEKLAEIFYAAYPTFPKEFQELAEQNGVAKGYELINLAFVMEGL
tara:strand:- start:15513 stop:16040 length:528 start_codon:yes stop_codon:yes gene_type:complete